MLLFYAHVLLLLQMWMHSFVNMYAGKNMRYAAPFILRCETALKMAHTYSHCWWLLSLQRSPVFPMFSCLVFSWCVLILDYLYVLWLFAACPDLGLVCGSLFCIALDVLLWWLLTLPVCLHSLIKALHLDPQLFHHGSLHYTFKFWATPLFSDFDLHCLCSLYIHSHATLIGTPVQ